MDHRLQVYPVVHSGVVVLLKQGFGFLEYGDPEARSRLYFSFSEVRARCKLPPHVVIPKNNLTSHDTSIATLCIGFGAEQLYAIPVLGIPQNYTSLQYWHGSVSTLRPSEPDQKYDAGA